MKFLRTEDRKLAVVMSHDELKRLTSKYLQVIGKEPIEPWELHMELAGGDDERAYTQRIFSAEGKPDSKVDAKDIRN